MAVRGFDPKEEGKSYGAIFFFSVCALVVVSLWAVFDDNFTRRPWKKYQAEFNNLDYDTAKAAYEAEDKKLEGNANYVELVKKLDTAMASLSEGKLGSELQQLRSEETERDVRFFELDQDVKFIKSELEEAWYEYDHAVQLGKNIRPYQTRIEELDKEQAKLDPGLEEARKKRKDIKAEIKNLQGGVKELDGRLAKLTVNRDKWLRVMQNATVSLGPITLAKIPSITQTILPEFDRNNFDEPTARVDRCQSCHSGINRAGFENQPNPYKTHPQLKVLLADNAHPTEKFGCTTCHDGQGAAVNSVEQAHYGKSYGVFGRRYWPHPLLKGQKVQASCASCHLDVQSLQDAPLLARGQRLFEQVGCTGCHLVEGYENIPKIGPSLRRVAGKVDPSWMVRWIRNPHEFRPRSRMPNFDFDESQATDIASYIWFSSKQAGEKWLKARPLPKFYQEGNQNLINRGRELVNSIGCKGCHGFAEGEFSTVLGTNKDIAPNLKDIAAKVGPQWIYHWIKNPRGYNPDTRMPSLRLSDEEALAITSYLMTLGRKGQTITNIGNRLADPKSVKRGESLVRKYGCPGCHDIPGMEKESRIGVELTTFGSKVLEELFFGNRKDIPHTWDDWTYNKLKTPRVYTTPRVEQLMPQFNFSDEDIKALRILLAGFRESKVPPIYKADHGDRIVNVVEGRRLVHQYNCIGCHTIENKGGFVRKYYPEDQQTLAPPVLNGEGDKVQPNWLFGFLKKPVPLRPWLKIRMPTFGMTNDEANLLVSFFTGLSKVEIPYVYFNKDKIPAGYLSAAKTMFTNDYFACLSCHQQGDKKPEGPPEGWAPDLTIAKNRLNPHWIVKWLQDPQKVEPGTKMPSFYPEGPDNILGGKDDKQIEALRDYIMVLGNSGSPQ